jgi:NDP-sugar pyrophosphorylase family protein
MINIVIPMAGRGKRFVDAAYKEPKPLIDVNGMPMISRVIDNLRTDEDVCFTFICLQDFIANYYHDFTKVVPKNSKIITVREVTEGAACTVLLAKENIDNENELIIANCDQLVLDPCFMQGSIDYYRKQKAHGGILCFLNDSPKWSYVRMSGGKIVEVVEKQVVSNLATVGLYYYVQGNIFVESAENMIANNIRVNGEFYVAPTYNDMLIGGLKVVPYLVNEMVGLGTPEDLNIYLRETNENIQS